MHMSADLIVPLTSYGDTYNSVTSTQGELKINCCVLGSQTGYDLNLI